MRPHSLQADQSDGHGLRGRGRSGVRQRTSLVTKVLGAHPAVCALAAVRHLLRDLQRVHGDHRLQLRTAVRPPHGLRAEPPILHRHAALAAHTAQLRAQPQVLGARVHGRQPVDVRRSGHHVLLHAQRHTQHFGKAGRGVLGNVPDVLLPHRVRHGSHRSGTLPTQPIEARYICRLPSETALDTRRFSIQIVLVHSEYLFHTDPPSPP